MALQIFQGRGAVGSGYADGIRLLAELPSVGRG